MLRQFCFKNKTENVETQQLGQTKGKTNKCVSSQDPDLPPGAVFQQLWIPPAETSYKLSQMLVSAEEVKRWPDSRSYFQHPKPLIGSPHHHRFYLLVYFCVIDT